MFYLNLTTFKRNSANRTRFIQSSSQTVFRKFILTRLRDVYTSPAGSSVIDGDGKRSLPSFVPFSSAYSLFSEKERVNSNNEPPRVLRVVFLPRLGNGHRSQREYEDVSIFEIRRHFYLDPALFDIRLSRIFIIIRVFFVEKKSVNREIERDSKMKRKLNQV